VLQPSTGASYLPLHRRPAADPAADTTTTDPTTTITKALNPIAVCPTPLALIYNS